MKENGKLEKEVKEPIYKKMWFWMIIASITLIVGVSFSLVDEKNRIANSKIEESSISEPDDSERSEIDRRASEAELKRLQSLEAANPQSESSNSEVQSIPSSSSQTSTTPATSTVPTEYLTALNRATKYSAKLSLSKTGIYKQLTSEYGDKYPPEAAQYAIDHLVTDFNSNALDRATYYQSKMDMSLEAIRDQLISDYGDGFTPEEADYAIQHLRN